MSTVATHSTVSALTGTPKEVRAKLGASQADRVLVLAFEQVKPTAFGALSKNLTNMASSMLDVLAQHHSHESLERLVEVMMPPAPPSPRLLKEAAMLVQARNAVLESGDLLTAAEVAQLAGLSARNPSVQPNKWKKQGLIFAVPHNGVDYFPGYGLDRKANFRPFKAMADVIKVFAGHKDAWGMAYWFHSENSFLGGKRPQDVLAKKPEQVIAAARDEVQGIGHG